MVLQHVDVRTVVAEQPRVSRQGVRGRVRVMHFVGLVADVPRREDRKPIGCRPSWVALAAHGFDVAGVQSA